MFEYQVSNSEFTVSTPFGFPDESKNFKTPDEPLRIFTTGQASLICALDEVDPFSHGYLALNPLADAVHLDIGDIVRHLEFTDPVDRVRYVYPVKVKDTQTLNFFEWHFMRMISENLTTILTDLDRGDTPEAQLGDLTDVVIEAKIEFLDALENPV